jgi:hypothetical protein
MCPELAYSPLGLCHGHESAYCLQGSPGRARLPDVWFGRFEQAGQAVHIPLQVPQPGHEKVTSQSRSVWKAGRTYRTPRGPLGNAATACAGMRATVLGMEPGRRSANNFGTHSAQRAGDSHRPPGSAGHSRAMQGCQRGRLRLTKPQARDGMHWSGGIRLPCRRPPAGVAQ